MLDKSDLVEPALLLLREAIALIQQGGDVAPAARFRIEALLEQLIERYPDRAEDLQKDVAAIVGAHGALHICAGAVQLDLWQQRAPVVPSTR